MLPTLGSFLLVVAAALALCGCGSSSYSSSRGTDTGVNGSGNSSSATSAPPRDPISGTPSPTGSNDLVVATASAGLNPEVVSVAVDTARTVSVTFTSTDGSPISGFGMISGSTAMPAGWSAPWSPPGGFTCASASVGSGCVLNLRYAPTAPDTGTLKIGYVFVDDSGMPNTGGSFTVAYAATTANNVDAMASPTGEINAVVGGTQSVNVSFTTDDGKAATNLALTTNLTSLPAGWSSGTPGFSCDIVSTGSGCLLALTFAPTAAVRGVLTLNYSFTDGSGTAQTGALNIPYSTSASNTVVATASPSGEIDAIQKTGGQSVTVTFTTDDGNAATGMFVTSNLAALPIGWKSASSGLTCRSVSAGNGCQLHLTYAPAALGSGTLVLTYAYTDGGGAARTGSLNVGYDATTDDNAVWSANPVGQINAVVGSGAQSPAVTFTTDDLRPATALRLTSSLSALPAGWSSTASALSCSGFGTGTTCQLPLTYAPTAYAAGTLLLNYTYINNAGKSKAGTVSLAYRATTNDNVIGTPNASSLSAVVNTSTPVAVAFTTDDGNPASAFEVTSDLSALPAGWALGSPSFACASVSSGSGCVLALTYAPVAAANGTLSFTYRYNDDSGTPKSGSVSILYSAM